MTYNNNMLQIKGISKTYKTGDLIQFALDKVSVNLRDNEFVSILGPSGSGKTTLLNIIGGLDQYDDGDLIINNVSTKKYKDRDWDSYRNHTIGFVFQSYNLIPHQSVLSNVEMALTIGGIKGKKRKQMALDALDKVGLKDQAHKKPNQMSGGQMQRVAIARALVNDPKILLADEPTGALDTTTSIQVMDLLKEVAKDRLVVMVTHNPELAEEYSNRIVRIKDGHIVSDSNPLIVEDSSLEKPKHKRLGKASMSIFTALRLSLNNLLTKKARTFLTAFAGSIGIIGIALILSLSTGFQNYIDKIQEDTLTSYPLTFNTETADISSMILGFISDTSEQDGTENVVEQQYISSMFSSIGTNDLPAFIKYTEEHSDELKDIVSNVKYSYSITPTIYTIDTSDDLVKLNPSSMLNTFYSDSTASMYSSIGAGGMGVFNEINDSYDRFKDDYDLLKGKWPEKYNELLLVLSEPNKISDLLVYSLGLRDYDEMSDLIQTVMKGETVESKNDSLIFTYDDLLKVQLKLVNPSDTYKYNEKYDIYEDMNEDEEFMKKMYEESEELKIVGIVAPNPESNSHGLNPGVCFSRDLTLHVMDNASKSELVNKQMSNEDINIFSGKRFDEDKDDKEQLDFQEMISVDEDMLKDAFKVNVDFEEMFDQEKIADIALEYGKQAAKEIDETSTGIAHGFEQIEIELGKSMVQAFLQTSTNYQITCDEYIMPGVQMFGCKVPDGEEDLYEDFKISVMGQENTIKVKKDTPPVMNYVFGPMTVDPTNENAPITPSALFEKQFISNELFTSSLDEIAKKFTELGLSKEDFKALVIPATKKIYEKSISSILSALSIDETVVHQVSIEDFNDAYSFSKDSYEFNFLKDSKSVLNSSDIKNANYMTAINLAKEFNYGLAAKAIGEALGKTLEPMTALGDGELMSIDTDKFAEAFKFDMSEDELQRIMSALLSGNKEKSYSNNLLSLGYQNVDEPTSISYFFKDFEAKEKFKEFVDHYNDISEEEKEIRYADITGLLMSGVKKIVDSVSYVLIAFVSISLIVSSIMIGIITYISVLERTKEIGILRALGASKRNISSIFNAETFIVGLLSGLIGVGTTILLNFPINNLIHSLTDNYDINAVLPTSGAIVLVILSVILTLLAGIIPSSAASRKDPVIALRTE